MRTPLAWLASGVLGIGLVLSPLVSALPTATAAPARPSSPDGCSDPSQRTTKIIASYSTPQRVVIGITQVKKTTYTVEVADGCEITAVITSLSRARGGSDNPLMDLVDIDGNVQIHQGNITWNPQRLHNAAAGRWVSEIDALGSDEVTSAGAGLRLLRASRLKLNATPEPVKKSAKLTIRGQLTRANWEKHRYAGYPHQRVALQFRTPNGHYTTIRTLSGSDDGSLITTVRADRDGCYRFAFAGTSTTGAKNSVGDCVDVR